MPRVAIVTGGTRGIGEAICIALREAGVTVAASFRQDTASARKFTDRTGITAFQWDVSEFRACEDAIGIIEDKLGPIDILVNNAGITRDASITKLSPEAWNEVISTNLGGAFNMSKTIFPGMRERKWGRIVNVGSINGQSGQFGQVNYSASKSALHGFSKSLAQEGARFGITVNTIAPGYIRTEMVAAMSPESVASVVARIPVGRLGHASEIARGVTFLCSEDSGFITGSTLSINGGQHMY